MFFNSGGMRTSMGCGTTTSLTSGNATLDVSGTQREYILNLPDGYDSSQPYKVIFGLHWRGGQASDVASGTIGLGDYYGLEALAQGSVIFVAPTFAQLPWYADHPTAPAVRQESHLLQVVIPFIEACYPVLPACAGRLLLGFSKSGWGAFSLILRHPHVFGRAVAWDAPLMEAAPKKYGMEPIFGTQANFEHYQITRLLRARAAVFSTGGRLMPALTVSLNDELHWRIASPLSDEIWLRLVVQVPTMILADDFAKALEQSTATAPQDLVRLLEEIEDDAVAGLMVRVELD